MLAVLLALASVPAHGLDGRWTSPCLAMGQNGRHGTIFRLTIVGPAVALVGQTYAHAGCDAPTVETRLTGTFSDLRRRRSRLTATMTVDDVTMTPQQADVVAIWNAGRAAKSCGAVPWRLGETQSVAGGDCLPQQRLPARHARLVVRARLAGGRLTLPYPLPGGGGAEVVLTRTQ